MKKTILLVALLAMAGCANLKFQWAASYQTDNLAEDMRAERAGAPAPTKP
jgi:Tfp pilus assembly protein PilV